MAKAIRTRIETLETIEGDRPLIMAIKGVDGIAVEGETLTEAEFAQRYPADQFTIHMQSVGFEVRQL